MTWRRPWKCDNCGLVPAELTFVNHQFAGTACCKAQARTVPNGSQLALPLEIR